MQRLPLKNCFRVLLHTRKEAERSALPLRELGPGLSPGGNWGAGDHPLPQPWRADTGSAPTSHPEWSEAKSKDLETGRSQILRLRSLSVTTLRKTRRQKLTPWPIVGRHAICPYDKRMKFFEEGARGRDFFSKKSLPRKTLHSYAPMNFWIFSRARVNLSRAVA